MSDMTVSETMSSATEKSPGEGEHEPTPEEAESQDLRDELRATQILLADAEKRLQEVRNELDRQGAAPSPYLHERVRMMSRSAKENADNLRDTIDVYMAKYEHANTLVLKGGATGTEVYPGRTKRKIDRTLAGVTHHFNIAGYDGYMIVNFFAPGDPGEVFFWIAKEGSTLGGLLTAFGKAFSRALQYGDTLVKLCYAFRDVEFEPKGATTNPDIPMAKSIVDYMARYLRAKYVPDETWQAYLGKKHAKVLKLADVASSSE